MRWFFFLLLVLSLSVLGLYAQEELPEPPVESEWVDYNRTLYTRGDKIFTISLGMLFPTVFTGALGENGIGLSTIGGTGSMAFNIFLNSHFFLGGEFGGMFVGTRGRSMLYMIPFGARIGYQLVYRRFEFPLSLLVGAAPQLYLQNSNYFGLVLKPGASVFWRFTQDWSFGLNNIWWFVPQWPKNGKNAYGNFLELTLSARYHF